MRRDIAPKVDPGRKRKKEEKNNQGSVYSPSRESELLNNGLDSLLHMPQSDFNDFQSLL